MLSALAHDLELEVTRFTLTVAEDRSRVEAWFDTGSLRVLGPAVLSASDREQIARNIREDVLHSARWPTARFASTRVAGTEDAWEVEGAFELHGKSRPLRARVRRAGGQWICELELHQPDFGIVPFRAALGTLKVKPGVRLRVSVPAP